MRNSSEPIMDWGVDFAMVALYIEVTGIIAGNIIATIPTIQTRRKSNSEPVSGFTNIPTIAPVTDIRPIDIR